jgi:hypothetical protein
MDNAKREMLNQARNSANKGAEAENQNNWLVAKSHY